MYRKTLLAVAALAITTGTLALNAPLAAARGKFSLSVGGYGLHGFRSYYAPKWGGPGKGSTCSTEYKKKKVQIWTRWGPKWVWVSKPVKTCR